MSCPLGWGWGGLLLEGRSGAGLPLPAMVLCHSLTTPTPVLSPLRNAPISQKGKLRLRDKPKAPQLRKSELEWVPRLLSQTRGYYIKKGRASPVCQGPAGLASFFTSELSQNTRDGGGGRTQGRKVAKVNQPKPKQLSLGVNRKTRFWVFR